MFFENYDTAIRHNAPGAILHDVTTFIYLLDPKKCEISTKKVVVDDFGSIREDTGGIPIDVIKTIDKSYVGSLLAFTFKKLKEG
jgi:inosine-uridine nucleoside N-ribohydrolase